MDKLDQLVERINQTEFVQNARPAHWLILGGLIVFLTNLVFGISVQLVIIFADVGEIFTTWLAVALLGEERGMNLLYLLENTDSADPYIITDYFEYAVDLALAIVQGMAAIGHALYKSFEISFPMLEDLDLDLDWIHLSLPQIGRSVFAFLQFIILFYIIRRVRRSIKMRIKKRIALLDNDYFDKQFFGVNNVS